MPGKQPKHRQRYFVPSGTEGSCEVTREVYLCWYSGRRQERYLLERDQKFGVVSLDAPADVSGEPAPYGSGIPSPDNLEEMVIRKLLEQKLCCALKNLSPEEQNLIYALFYQNVGVRSNGNPSQATAMNFCIWAAMSKAPMSMCPSCWARKPLIQTLLENPVGATGAIPPIISLQAVSCCSPMKCGPWITDMPCFSFAANDRSGI